MYMYGKAVSGRSKCENKVSVGHRPRQNIDAYPGEHCLCPVAEFPYGRGGERHTHQTADHTRTVCGAGAVDVAARGQHQGRVGTEKGGGGSRHSVLYTTGAPQKR